MEQNRNTDMMRQMYLMSHNLQYGTNSLMNRFVPSQVREYVKVTSLDRFKNAFGKEYFISGFTNTDTDNQHIFNFLRDNVRNFDKNYVDNNMNLKNFIYMGKIDKGTYIYVSTKMYVPNKLATMMMDNNDRCDIYIYIFGKKSRRYIKQLDSVLVDSKE